MLHMVDTMLGGYEAIANLERTDHVLKTYLAKYKHTRSLVRDT